MARPTWCTGRANRCRHSAAMVRGPRVSPVGGRGLPHVVVNARALTIEKIALSFATLLTYEIKLWPPPNRVGQSGKNPVKAPR